MFCHTILIYFKKILMLDYQKMYTSLMSFSDFDSKHGTPNKVAGHLSHFSSEFHNILALTLKKLWHNPPFSLNFALFFISLIFKHCHTQNGGCQGFENKIFLFWSSRYYIKLPMYMYIILMRLFNNWPQRPSFVTSASIW